MSDYKVTESKDVILLDQDTKEFIETFINDIIWKLDYREMDGEHYCVIKHKCNSFQEKLIMSYFVHDHDFTDDYFLEKTKHIIEELTETGRITSDTDFQIGFFLNEKELFGVKVGKVRK